MYVCKVHPEYVLFDEISLLLLPYIPHSGLFDRRHRFALLCIEPFVFQPFDQQRSFETVPSYGACAGDVCC